MFVADPRKENFDFKLTKMSFDPSNVEETKDEELIRDVNEFYLKTQNIYNKYGFDKLLDIVAKTMQGRDLLLFQFILNYKDELKDNKGLMKVILCIKDPRYLLELIKKNYFPDKEKEIFKAFCSINDMFLGDYEDLYVDLKLKYGPFVTDASFFEANRDLHNVTKPSSVRRLFENKEYQNFANILLSNLDFEDLLPLYKMIDDDLVKFSVLSAIEFSNSEKAKLLKANPFRTIAYQMIVDPSLNTRRKAINSTGKVQLEEIDPTITIGVELECVNDNDALIELLKNFETKKFLKDWTIETDGSVYLEIRFLNDKRSYFIDGMEFVSPVLTYDNDSLKELKAVCNALKKLGFFTNETCGGHIHLGYDYFKTKEEFIVFLNLYGVCENFLYLASNKARSSIRKDALDEYAKSNRDMIYNLSIHINDFQSLADFEWEFSRERKYDESRYHGLNLVNIGHKKKNTIEFRMPNGEIDFENLKLNIELFCSLIMTAKRIAHTQDEELIRKYKNLFLIKDEDRLVRAILNLLFSNEELRKKFKNRYYTVKQKSITVPKHYAYDIERGLYEDIRPKTM